MLKNFRMKLKTNTSPPRQDRHLTVHASIEVNN